MCGHVDAEKVQALKGALYGLRILGPHDVEVDFEVVDGRLVGLPFGFVQKHRYETLGLIEVSSSGTRTRRILAKVEREFVAARPGVVAE